MAISPIMNDQWSGNTLFSAVRAKRATPSRLSSPRTRLLDDHQRSRFQKPGPTGWSKSLCGPQEPVASRPCSGSWGSERVAGPNTGVAPLRDLERRLVARAEQALDRLLVQADRAAGVRADLRVGDVARRAPRSRARAGGDVGVGRAG